MFLACRLSSPLQYLVIVAAVVVGYSWVSAAMFPADNFRDSKHPTGTTPGESEAESPDPPRNFTKEQLAVFDGTKDVKTGTDKPVYLSLNGIVFDVSKGRYVVVLALPI